MKVVKRTPLSELQAKLLWRRTKALADDLATALEVPSADIEREMDSFIYLSANIEFEAGEIEWEPARALDDDPALAAKFLRYMASDITPINAASALVMERDRPHDEALAPTPPDVTQKNA